MPRIVGIIMPCSLKLRDIIDLFCNKEIYNLDLKDTLFLNKDVLWQVTLN